MSAYKGILTTVVASAIKKDLNKGMTIKDISIKYDIKPNSISEIYKGVTFTTVKPYINNIYVKSINQIGKRKNYYQLNREHVHKLLNSKCCKCGSIDRLSLVILNQKINKIIYPSTLYTKKSNENDDFILNECRLYCPECYHLSNDDRDFYLKDRHSVSEIGKLLQDQVSLTAKMDGDITLLKDKNFKLEEEIRYLRANELILQNENNDLKKRIFEYNNSVKSIMTLCNVFKKESSMIV